jgi:hypothetical protein
MPNDAIYHRTLSPVPVYDPVTKTIINWGTGPLTGGYWLSRVLGSSSKTQIGPLALYSKPLQCFEDYATQFEKDFSSVTREKAGRAGMEPIIDDNRAEVQSGAYAAWPDHEVIAHLGWVSGMDVHVPKGTNTSKTHLSDLLADKVPLWVARTSPSGYTRYGTSETSFHLGTQIDGGVIWYFGTRNAGALQQPFADDRSVGAGVSASRFILKNVARGILLGF